MRAALKSVLLYLCLALVAPWVLAERAARRCCGHDLWFEPQAEWISLLPGRFGIWCRAAFYHLSLASCPLDVAIQFGAIITHSEAQLGHRVYLGLGTIVGWVRIGDDTMLADRVQALSGARHHLVSAPGAAPRQAHPTRLTPVDIGRDCWIGGQAVLMASVGDASIVGAGSVVTRAVPAGVTAAGNPARVLPPKLPLPCEAAWRCPEQGGHPLPAVEACPQATNGSDPATSGKPPASALPPEIPDRPAPLNRGTMKESQL